MSQKQETQEQPVNPYAPVVIEDHEADKAERKAARDKKQPVLRKCLDPITAGEHESKKPTYEWKVKFTYTRPNEKGRLESHAIDKQIVAQTAGDAWARVCDSIGVWPGPNTCDREITKLSQR